MSSSFSLLMTKCILTLFLKRQSTVQIVGVYLVGWFCFACALVLFCYSSSDLQGDRRAEKDFNFDFGVFLMFCGDRRKWHL